VKSAAFAAAVLLCTAFATATGAEGDSQSARAAWALPAEATGDEIFRAACATCHGADGKGAPSSVVGFDLPLPNGHEFPDFTDCPTNTVEPSGDWIAVVHSGGPVRGLDRHMPAFGDALSASQIERVVKHLWTFCRDARWPRGDLNLPRALFTEKAFPENEALFLTQAPLGAPGAIAETIVYEHRFGSRGTYELAVPLAATHATASAPWSGGLGDVEVTVRQTLHASHLRGTIVAAGAAVTLPTGRTNAGLGNGYVIYEPLLLAGQMLGANGFVQAQAGYEIVSDRTKGANEAFLRTAAGYTWAQDAGLGRAWTPMVELLLASPERSSTQWDVAPQMQVSLSKLQHILVNVGVRVPLTQRDTRKPQIATYLLWDWFDGGFFHFWR
jgi:mono/diheme cytochrome c family protein